MGRCRWILTSAAAALSALHAVSVRAEPTEPAPCFSSVWRDPILSFSQESSRLPSQAVLVEPGDTVCLAGRAAADGTLRDLRLSTAEDLPVVEIALEARSPWGRVAIRNRSSQRIRVRTSKLVGGLRLARPLPTLEVAPGEEGELSHYGQHGVLVTEVRLLPETRQKKPDPGIQPTAMPLSTSHSWTFTPFLVAGLRELRLSSLNRTVVRDGFTTARTNWDLAGMLFDLGIARFHLGMELLGSGLFAKKEPAALALSYAEIVPSMAYDVFPSSRLSGVLRTGLVLGVLGLNPCADGYREFASRMTDNCEQGQTARRQLWGWSVEVGGEYRLPLGRVGNTQLQLTSTYSIGYVFPLGASEWEAVEGTHKKLGPSPDVSAAGFRALLRFGLGLF